jgi:hypothetical protein
LLAYLEEGNELWDPRCPKADREYFDQRIAGLVAASDDEIPLTSIIDNLSQAHPSKADFVKSMAPMIERLIVAYASFPFSTPVTLTKDALCRAMILLTERGQSCWCEGKSRGDKRQIRSRSLKRQLSFLYSALVRPPTGAPTRDDVLEVICRIAYPCDVTPHTMISGDDYLDRRHYADFVPLAERLRLEPVQDAQPLEPLPASQIQLLQAFVSVFNPPYCKEPVYPGFIYSEDIDEEEFIGWATEVCEVL